MSKTVTLRPDSRWVDWTDCNPLNTPGKIIGFDPDDDVLYLRVRWDTGYTNWYGIKDLEEV